MRTLIVSDIHSNIVALNAVFESAEEYDPVERVICLGDTVGYGPAPMECLEALWERHAVSIQGNHDAAAAGTMSTEHFNVYAAAAAEWTTAQLSGEATEYLAGLPDQLIDESFLLVHGSPKDPLWDYVFTYDHVIEAWARTERSDILVGHTHLQFSSEAGLGIERPGPDGLNIPLGDRRTLTNPGSVGQPRDGDPRAAYAIYDDASRMVKLYRAWYDISATQRAMADAGLPEPLISRLSLGK